MAFPIHTLISVPCNLGTFEVPETGGLVIFPYRFGGNIQPWKISDRTWKWWLGKMMVSSDLGCIRKGEHM